MPDAVTTYPAATVKATRRDWFALVILVLPTLLVSMDMTVTYLALPAISAALKPTSSQLLWITDIYSFIDASLLIVMGSLGDRIGLRRLLLTGGFGFAAASTLAAFSTSAMMLIVSRGLLGVAGATLLTSTISIIRNIFHDDKQRTLALGLYTTCFSSGTMLGPLAGGFLLSHFWWGSVFLIAVPLMVLLLATAPFLLPEFKDKQAGKLDILSAALLVIAILAGIYGIKQMAQDGFGLLPLMSIVTGISVSIVFFRRQQVLQHPLIDLHLFTKTTFNAALLALFTGLFAWGGIFLFVGQYLQLVAGLDAFKAGLYTMPSAGGSIVLCMLAPVALRRFRRGQLIACGLFILATGICLLSLVGANSLTLLVVATILMSGGCGVTVTLGIDMVVASAPPQKAGAAAGISETSTGFGGALGVAILGSIWTILYRSDISNHIPSNISPMEAGSIRSTLGDAVSVAKKLDNSNGASLITSAREAFVHSFNITCCVCAVIIVAMAVFVAVRLKRV